MKRLVLALLFVLSPFSVAFSADIKGTWTVQDGSSRITFEPCGAKICGKIVWLKDEAAGAPAATDVNNGNPSLRSRRLLGLRLMEFANKQNSWAGTVYNPNDGQTYQAEATVLAPNKLQIRGCAPGGILCDSEVWTRYN